VETAREFIKITKDIIIKSGFLINLADSDGYILLSEGNDDMQRRISILNRKVGIYRNERITGTSGIALVLVEDKPIQITAYEHYNINFHNITCSSAPIHDINGNLIGVVNISGDCRNVNAHNLGLIINIAAGIELGLRYRNVEKEKENYIEIINLMTQKDYEGFIIFNSNGTITRSNTRGFEILSSLIGYENTKNLNKIDEISNFFQKNNKKINKEIQVVIEGDTKSFIITPRLLEINNVYKKNKCLFFIKDRTIKKEKKKILAEKKDFTFENIIGSHKKICYAIQSADLAARVNAPVLIIGETGTGKEIFAKAIHNASFRYNKPFIAINCSAIPENLIESELFGYESGSFTGAKKGGNIGKFEMANGGTIFLDELDSMPLHMQPELLRVIQTGKLYRIGGKQEITLNIRVISASKKDLYEEIKKGTFRDDLYFRLNIITIKLPPLRDRKSDIPILCEHFIKHLNSLNNKNIKRITSETERIFMTYDWPGNIRELEGCIERACIYEKSSYITPHSLPSNIFNKINNEDNENISKNKYTLKKQEYELIKKTIKICSGNITNAALSLGITRSTLYRKMKQYNIQLK